MCLVYRNYDKSLGRDGKRQTISMKDDAVKEFLGSWKNYEAKQNKTRSILMSLKKSSFVRDRLTVRPLIQK